MFLKDKLQPPQTDLVQRWQWCRRLSTPNSCLHEKQLVEFANHRGERKSTDLDLCIALFVFTPLQGFKGVRMIRYRDMSSPTAKISGGFAHADCSANASRGAARALRAGPRQALFALAMVL
jgi:hypothetical protein